MSSMQFAPSGHDLFHPRRYWTDSPGFIAQFDATDSELDLEESLSGRYAFRLGEDHGLHRLAPQEVFAVPEVQRGYEHGLKQQARPSDVYLRKLLGIKRSAFERGIPVSSALTAEFLREIDVPVCPVSGVVLTHGTKGDTDWSIDRLDNSLGYVPGNLCAVSTRVNKLKNVVSFEDLFLQAQSTLVRDGEEGLYSETECGLLCIEAFRMASLMAAPSAFAKGKLASFAPFALAPTTWSTFEGVIASIHVQCARTLTEGAAYTRRKGLFKRLGPSHWRASNRLVQASREALAKGVHPCDIWFDGRALEHLQQLIGGLHENPPSIEGAEPSVMAANVKAMIRPLNFYAR